MEEFPIPNNQYPPGIRFHPSDEELISFYLQRKMKSLPLPPNVITDIHLYSYDPWDLPRNTRFGDEELYFFTPRDRKYPNGGRPNRAAASGYWKATGTDQPIRSSFGSRKIGVKKGLVFYKGKPPSGHRMDWVMTEYRLPDTSRPSRSTGSMRLDDWVLCRIRQKGNMSKNEIWEEHTAVCSSQICRQNQDSARDMLSDYLKSNEYNLIVSLLAGHDLVSLSTPSTIYENGDGSRATESEKMDGDQRNMEQMPSNMMTNAQREFAFQSGPSVAATDARSYGQHVCKPRYSSNADINLQELDMLPPLQENFLN